jgi:hypothetical protein
MNIKVSEVYKSAKNAFGKCVYSFWVPLSRGFMWGYVSDVRSVNLNSVNQLIFVIVKCGVLFEVRTGFLNKM